ncbi:Rv1476 family membrane protein [Nocardia sp. NPDC004711]
MTAPHSSVFTPSKAELPPNTDLNAIIADLADDHVAAPTGRDQEALAAIAADAREHGVQLDIIVVQGNPGIEANLRDLANEVGKIEHGTVVVFSDDWVGTYSDQFSRGHLEWAEDKAKYRGPEHTTDAARVFVDRLEQPETVSWTVITLVILGVLIATIGGLYAVKVRRGQHASGAPTPVG